MNKSIVLVLLGSIVWAQMPPKFVKLKDDAFEQALIDQGYDDKLDGKVERVNIFGILELDISDKGIRDLTGIKYFRALKSLDCSKNKISNLDVSGLRFLWLLHCYNNHLRKIDVTYNIQLSHLWCGNNPLTKIDLTTNRKIKDLDVAGTKIKIVDVSKNRQLRRLWVHNMESLTRLDLSMASLLTELHCYKNKKIRTINLTNGNNESIKLIDCKKTPALRCVQVDDAGYAFNQSQWDFGKKRPFKIDCTVSHVKTF